MARASRGKKKIIGLILAVLGIGLAIWGYQLSASFGSQITYVITGSDTDRVMTLYILGAISFFVGIYLFKKN